MTSLRPKLMAFHKLGTAFVLACLLSCQQSVLEPGTYSKDLRNTASKTYLAEQSPKSALKLKRTRILRNYLAKVLALQPQALCLELGSLPCADVVHAVNLGGMDAYGNAQYLTPKYLSVASPIALDRIVMASCATRASLDLVNPKQGVIFKDLLLTPDGRISKNDAFYQSIQRLYERALLRPARSDEVAALEKLYVDIYEKEPIGAARNWALLTCYVVLSSLEAVFY